jgi:hypothetical protein
LAGAVHLSWLLWRYVPPHAALFEALGIVLPADTRLAVLASNWFVRLLPFAVLLALGLGGLVLLPLSVRALANRQRSMIGVLVATISALGIAEFGGSALVIRAMRTGCSSATADPRFPGELSGLRRTGESVCPAYYSQ